MGHYDEFYEAEAQQELNRRKAHYGVKPEEQLIWIEPYCRNFKPLEPSAFGEILPKTDNVFIATREQLKPLWALMSERDKLLAKLRKECPTLELKYRRSDA